MGTIFSVQPLYQMRKTMKCYLLLRDNVETGPFDLAEITAQNLYPTDLIWVEGSSKSWRYPAEIQELAPLVQHQAPGEDHKFQIIEKESDKQKPSKNIYVALPPGQKEAPAEAAEPQLEVLYQQPLETLKENWEKNVQKRRLRSVMGKAEKVTWLAALMTGLLAGAFMIKKMVDTLDGNGMGRIGAAAIPATAYPVPAEKVADPTYQNALTTEVVPVDTAAVAAPKKKEKKVNLKKLVTLDASTFKKGVFGGINRLSFTVNNQSDHVLDKVTIEVRYLKPNGDVIRKENYYVRAVAPRSTKTLDVPPSNRGVDVKYRITNIQSHEAQVPMRDV